MNETNVVNVDVLTKRFESFQSSKKPLLDEKRRHENNANKRNIKRTPAFRRDVNITRKLVVDHSQAVMVTNNEKQFSNIIISNTSECNKTTTPTDSHSYNKTDSLNQKLYLDTFAKDDKNKLATDQKSIINCLKKRLETNGITAGCKPKVPKKNFELPQKPHLPIGPPPKKPPRTFAHDKQIDLDLPYNCTMESHKNTKSDPKAMLEKLEKFITKNSHTYGPKDEKTTGKDCNSNISSKKSNLFNLAKSLKCPESDKPFGNSLKIHHTDEQNYLTRKLYNEYDVEHIYDQPIFLKPNSRPNIDTANNCHTLIIGNDQICDSNKSNLHYMSTPIKDYNSEVNLKESESYFQIDTTDELDSKTNKNMTMTHERKIQMLMNEAYGTFVKTQEESDSNCEDSSSGSINNLTDKNISEQTLERKGYLRRVAKKITTSSCSTIVHDKNHLFQALLLIGLDLSSTKEKLPYIKHKYPTQAKIPEQFENLCFPDAHVWPFTADDCRTYSLTVTDENGRRNYGYCYRVQPEGAAYCLPLVYCIYSSIKANSFYFKVLQEIESRHGLSEFNMKMFIKLLYDQPFPELGSSIYLPLEPSSYSTELPNGEGVLRIPFDILNDQDDLLKLLNIIKPNTFIQMLATMLLERKLILLSKSISLLSSSIEALTSSLYPFAWQHTLVSVLPSQMVSVADFVQAPTPYIIGLLKTDNQSDIFSQLSEKDQVFIFDLDANKTLRKVKDEYSVLPSRIAKGLKNVIGLKVELDQSTKAVLASESLIRLFVELVGHYKSFILSNTENKYNFQKQFFIDAGINTAHRNFLEWFTETAMFTTFLNNKMHNNIDKKDVFECRCDEFSNELSKIKRKSKTLQSMKAIGDRIKEWAVS
ncbi:PREDICTED: DENN domain-containing protein 2A-like [Diuraphis noxia]|uniref:DENN domain-containing protein 2A-like n=1 Tax=Diuraphis noxia TaxID=143948 RepID=UPI00076388C5|nr:PREDICTED: DENN domain-containing protein 2A-like [Diuraphis noxia]